jgi:hypothetical protein
MGDEILEAPDLTSGGTVRWLAHPCARDIPKKKKPGGVTQPGFEEGNAHAASTGWVDAAQLISVHQLSWF